MKIARKRTINDIMRKHGPLFLHGATRITEEIASRPPVETLRVKRPMLWDRRIRARSVSSLTLGELDAINSRDNAEECFTRLLAVMLGLVHFKARRPDGRPDWFAGWEIDEKAVGNLRFIRAMRYFIQVQKELDRVSAVWNRLGAWRTDLKKTKRPDRGMLSVCRQYCQMMNGAINMDDAWNTPWLVVFEAFESCDIDNKIEHERFEEMKRQRKR